MSVTAGQRQVKRDAAGVRFQVAAPVMVERLPEEEAAARSALQGLFRDFLEGRLDSTGRWSVNQSPESEEPE